MAEKIRINRRKDYKQQLKLYLNLSKSLNAKLKKLFRKTARLAEQEYIQYEDMYYLFIEDFSNDLYKILSSHYRSVITTASQRIIKQREEKAEGNIDKIVDKYINENTASKVSQVSETTRQNIKRSVKKGIAEGMSVTEVAKEIRQNNGFKPYRATMIARTETHMAMSYGNNEISKTLGFRDGVKEWNSAFDDRTRSWHKAMNGTVVKLDETFKVFTPLAGGGTAEKIMDYTGDSNGGALNIINCRCFTLYYDSEDEVIGDIPKPDSPIVPEAVATVAVRTTVPKTFFGFGATTKTELEFHKEAWNDSPAKYKQIPAKFPPVNVAVTNRGCYYDNVNLINMKKTRTGYSKHAIWVHEYGHFVDKKTVRKSLRDDNKIGKKINTILKADERNTIDYGSLVYAEEIVKDVKRVAQNIKDGTYKYAHKLPPKNGAGALRNFEDQYKLKYGYDEATNTFTKLQTKKDVEIFLDDIFQDGVFFKKDEIKQLLNFDKISDRADRAIRMTSFLNAVNYRFANQIGLIDTHAVHHGGNGIFYSLRTFVMTRDKAKKEVTVNARTDIDHLADYMGAITTNAFGYGHTNSYYRREGARVRVGNRVVTSDNSTEAFAEYLSLSASPQSELFRKKMEELAPNTKKSFDEYIDDILEFDDIE